MSDLDLSSPAAYAESCRRIANRDFAGRSLAEVEAASEDYNAYPGLAGLTPPRSLITLEDYLDDDLRDRARRAVLEGLIFWEHAAAGEATRLKLGPKYLIEPGQVAPSQPGLLTLPLGARHLWQWVLEITGLAREAGLDPARVLARQQLLLVVNEGVRETITRRILAADFLGLNPENFLLLTQPAFPGLTRGPDGWNFDPATARRLHNHGQMAMQKTMGGQIFHLDRAGQVHRLSQAEFFGRLAAAADLVSYNIEDLDYLTRALDFETIGLALRLADQGYGMTMEIVAQNPDHPVKGGLCAFDPALSRDVVIESFRLRDLAPAQISHLNKNFNHYPNPARVFQKLHQEGLFMPVVVKDGGLYFQTVQGDLNFLVKTAFITRRAPVALRSWKSAEDTPAALAAMARQDAQPGFAALVGLSK